jgi:hypothetical protein
VNDTRYKIVNSVVDKMIKGLDNGDAYGYCVIIFHGRTHDLYMRVTDPRNFVCDTLREHYEQENS